MRCESSLSSRWWNADIEDDSVLFERYRYLIPVLDIEGGPILYPPHTWQSTSQALSSAMIDRR